MALGPVFIIHSGTADDRTEAKESLVQAWQDTYPCWTETSDLNNSNLIVAFASNSRDAWDVSVDKTYQALNSENCSTLDVRLVDAGGGNHAVSTGKPSDTMSFGFTRYP